MAKINIIVKNIDTRDEDLEAVLNHVAIEIGAGYAFGTVGKPGTTWEIEQIPKPNKKELDARCQEVFCADDGETFTGIREENGETVLTITNGNFVSYDYIPDMTGRPEALAYIKGERESFSD